MISQDRPELAQTAVDCFILNLHPYGVAGGFQIGKNHAGTKMNLIAEDRIADITKMWYLGAMKQHSILEFTGVAQYAVVANNDVAADVRPTTNFTVGTDNRRALDHCSVLDHRSRTDLHVFSDVR